MAKSQLPGSRGYENQMAVHTSTHTEYVSLSRKDKNNCHMHHIKMVSLIRLSIENRPVGGIGLSMGIMYKNKQDSNHVDVKICCDIKKNCIEMFCSTFQNPWGSGVKKT